MGRPATGQMPSQNFRYPHQAWAEVGERAKAELRNASEVTRILLDAYRSGELRVLPDGRLRLRADRTEHDREP